MYAERGRVGAPFGFLARCFLSAGPAMLLQTQECLVATLYI